MLKTIFQWFWPSDLSDKLRIDALEADVMVLQEEVEDLQDHVEDHCERLEWCHTHIEALFDALGGSKKAPIDPTIN